MLSLSEKLLWSQKPSPELLQFDSVFNPFSRRDLRRGGGGLEERRQGRPCHRRSTAQELAAATAHFCCGLIVSPPTVELPPICRTRSRRPCSSFPSESSPSRASRGRESDREPGSPPRRGACAVASGSVTATVLSAIAESDPAPCRRRVAIKGEGSANDSHGQRRELACRGGEVVAITIACGVTAVPNRRRRRSSTVAEGPSPQLKPLPSQDVRRCCEFLLPFGSDSVGIHCARSILNYPKWFTLILFLPVRIAGAATMLLLVPCYAVSCFCLKNSFDTVLL
ncbi:uncharacterized protein LOC110271592 [Arachis ipaensis]|uniref:uncharacterized protein LOC110271592 n=1 Tax=Arachis ipaensis TaxID=130454 RepID=UPI000A2B2B01|nr:uncharacterized protein LOC110271592 [Arachis ipaensis]